MIAIDLIPVAGEVTSRFPCFLHFCFLLFLRPTNLTSPVIFKKASKTWGFQFLSGYKAQSGTVAKSLVSPSFSSSAFNSLGISVIRLRTGWPPICSWPIRMG